MPSALEDRMVKESRESRSKRKTSEKPGASGSHEGGRTRRMPGRKAPNEDPCPLSTLRVSGNRKGKSTPKSPHQHGARPSQPRLSETLGKDDLETDQNCTAGSKHIGTTDRRKSVGIHELDVEADSEEEEAPTPDVGETER
jgi:hypothetical protein